ncbi:MAG TPA: SDR family NAD(P)-dependent oxidoreductase [Herpetosiphonaceae bacterium]|nr:SDR family NAD(P)-dependent oxidoreductase [Herpetosiphonaceae bacterium]
MKDRAKYAPVAAAAVGVLAAARALRRREAIDFRGKSVVITGGSRGLGLLMARELADEGARLTILARTKDDLKRAEEELRARGAEVLALRCDVRDRKQAQGAIQRAIRHYGRIDVLINNAGEITAAPIEHMEIEDFESAMDVHLWGPLYTMFAAVPHMRDHGGGHVVNISSIGGKISVPHLVPYSTSKFALVGLSDGMRAELGKYNIKVTTVCPGLMRTGSHFNALFKGRQREEMAWFSVVDALPGSSIDAERAAHQIIEACRHGDPELIISAQAQVAARLGALFPEVTATAMAIFDRMLPKATGPEGNQKKTGWRARSGWAPSTLTTLADRATEDNNELRGRGSVDSQSG